MPSMQGLIFIILIFPSMAVADWVGNTIEVGSPIIQKSFISKNKTLTFEPNPLSEVTLSFIGPQYAFGLRFTGENEDDGELFESNYSDFVISFYTSSYLVDIFYISFEDFYIQSDLEEMQASNQADTLEGSSFGLQLTYFEKGNIFEFFGARVFDPKTNYDFYLKLRFEHKTIQADNKIIPSKYQSDFSKMANVEAVTTDALDAGIGIAGLYAWDYFYINSYFMLGPSFEYMLIEENENREMSLISPVAEAFVGVAYYSKGFQLGYRSLARAKSSQINGIRHIDGQGSNYIYVLWIF